MDLKNAVAVCLISLFSATIVVLIARSLDLQAAARLEPVLLKIAAELEGIRKQSGGFTAMGDRTQPAGHNDGLIVYYFHGNTRCPSCRAIESQTRDVLQKDFAEPLSEGQILWETVNYENPAIPEIVKTFEIQVPVIVLAFRKAGKIDRWKRLDEVWGLYDEPVKFAEFIRREIQAILAPTDGSSSASGSDSRAASAPRAANARPADPPRAPAAVPIPEEEPAISPPVPRIPVSE